jgi:phenylglyoxylate dehydrogenase epsilon subunit
MQHSKYLILGSSHAALEAATAIRFHDSESTVTLLTRDVHRPYSPTVLPYIVSGRSRPADVLLHGEAFFHERDIALVLDTEIAGIDPVQSRVRLRSGASWRYDRLLIATGAAPAMPPVEGLSGVPFHVLRSMEDASRLCTAIKQARSAIVVGAGLIGMHAAENMAHAGLAVTVVEVEPHPLSGYFEPRASTIIRDTFIRNEVRMLMGRTATAVERKGEGCQATLDDGLTVAADLLLVCAGVRPNIGLLEGSTIETDAGILVDDRMRTNVPGVWAAGDVAQARGFWGGSVVNAILPNAVEQGRIAGLDMAGDPGLTPFAGAVPLNTYNFFGQHAISVGRGAPAQGDGSQVEEFAGDDGVYRRIVLEDGCLAGIAAINDFVDAGIMWQLIRNHTDLSPFKAQFVANPRDTGRQLMSRTWR